NEAAIKLARGYFYKKGQPRAKIVSALHSFHGRTLATAAVTGQPKYSAPFAPLPVGFCHIPFNDPDALRESVTADTCAVMLELVQGESGVRPADPAYARLAEELCRQTGARLIIDEIQTGMGRTGSFLASQHYGIQPDIVTLAKGLAGGVPIGAIIANEDTASGFEPGDHGSTFGGNPLACAAALAVLDEYEATGLVEAAAIRGRQLQDALRGLASVQPMIKEIRGIGLMIGIELAQPHAAAIKLKLMAKGYLVGSVGASILRLLPPLILPESVIEPFITDLQDTLKEAAQL
ncbi:MAG TPA: aspartate aminotransferase family protein, partial [Clostridiales bacterium]|nr:aspartate aminotransferase family protein [Clostridiales bacterium]